MKKSRLGNWKKYGFEFFSIFIAVVSAFALNNWNENRRSLESENKILMEIVNGLEEDIEDVKMNVKGHEIGIDACAFFKRALSNKVIKPDSLMPYYFGLTRDYISVQNTAGYETLKSRGLELVKNDSLRLLIISLYEYDYNALRKFEEEYSESQFHENYFEEIDKALAPNFQFDENNNIVNIDIPLVVPEEEKKVLLLHLLKIKMNRQFILGFYSDITKKIEKLQMLIKQEIEMSK